MTSAELEKLKYPIGKLELPEKITKEDINRWILTLEEFPNRLIKLVENLSEEELEKPYRPGGWTIRQTIHHIADSHQHSYIRFKWALTEKESLIKAYNEQDWAELEDAKSAPIDISLNFIKALHSKLVYVLKTLSMDDLDKVFIHPEGQRVVSLKQNVANYAWHSLHHYAHIENALNNS